jgi:hypothetical protein
MNNQLGRVLTTRGSERDRLLSLASQIHQKYQNIQIRDRGLIITFQQLLSLLSFFDFYHSGRFMEAMTVTFTIESYLSIYLAHRKPRSYWL